MEIREWAHRILSASTLEEKLLSPKFLTDKNPGPKLLIDRPTRPSGMAFKKFSKQDKLPAFHEHKDEDNRAICLHRFLGHELMAVEIMAYALLAFPKAPKHFRKGLANTLKEEQWHVKLYQSRLKAFGCEIDSLPFNGHFWKYTKLMTTPLEFVSIMHLTLEMANLDFAPHYGSSFEKHGDIESAHLMKQIFEDELSHVGFGYHWLKKMKPEDSSDSESYIQSLNGKISIKHSSGFIFFKDARLRAGLSEKFITDVYY